MFCFQKVPIKEKNVKENYFLIFDCSIKNIYKNIKYNYDYLEIYIFFLIFLFPFIFLFYFFFLTFFFKFSEKKAELEFVSVDGAPRVKMHEI